MKKQAICIQCHTKFEMVNFIIESLPMEYFDFYIHVDKKSNIFDQILRKENVFFAERKDVRWGRFSQVEATLSMFSMIDTEKYSYVHLISGNCFIIKSPEFIIDFFSNTDLQYIQSSFLSEKNTWAWHGWDRYSVRYPQWMIQRPSNKFLRFIRVCYREFIMRTQIFKRKNLPVPKFYGGSSWFSITGDCANWIIEYLNTDEGKEYKKFFRNGVCSDEVFFPTLVRYSPFSDKILANSAGGGVLALYDMGRNY